MQFRRSLIFGSFMAVSWKAWAMWPFGSASVDVVTPTGLKIEDKPGDVPKFERIYSAELSNGRTIVVKCRTTYDGSRYKNGELDQPGGRWVLFDPDNVADKIIDPALVPLVQGRCDEISKVDKAFIASKPSEFVDDAGVRWRRVDVS